jgi:mRNA interferase RelE/StbE
LSFDIRLGSKAQHFLKTCDRDLYDRIIEKLVKLGDDPFPHDMKRLIGTKEKTFRVRVGGYRILYVVLMDENVILVANIDKRPKVYQI